MLLHGWETYFFSPAKDHLSHVAQNMLAGREELLQVPGSGLYQVVNEIIHVSYSSSSVYDCQHIMLISLYACTIINFNLVQPDVAINYCACLIMDYTGTCETVHPYIRSSVLCWQLLSWQTRQLHSFSLDVQLPPWNNSSLLKSQTRQRKKNAVNVLRSG